MRPPPPVAAQQCGVFSTAQALRSGWTSHALRHAVERGRLDRIRAGVYGAALARTGVPHVDAVALLRRRAAALSVANRRVPVSHSAAAAVLHPALAAALVDPPNHVCATFPRGHRGVVSGAHLHRARLLPGQVIRLGQILLTSPERTVLDLGRELGADAAVAAADAALRNRLTTPADLAAAGTACAGWPGMRAAARAIAVADASAESALESISRLRMADAGLPAPQPQMRIFDEQRHFCGRVDFYWDEFGVVGEADGLGKYVRNPLALREEKLRQSRMEDCGLIFVRWGWSDLDDFTPVLGRLGSAFARGIRSDRPPRRWRALPSAA